jgi:hypothetical protein
MRDLWAIPTVHSEEDVVTIGGILCIGIMNLILLDLIPRAVEGEDVLVLWMDEIAMRGESLRERRVDHSLIF